MDQLEPRLPQVTKPTVDTYFGVINEESGSPYELNDLLSESLSEEQTFLYKFLMDPALQEAYPEHMLYLYQYGALACYRLMRLQYELPVLTQETFLTWRDNVVGDIKTDKTVFTKEEHLRLLTEQPEIYDLVSGMSVDVSNRLSSQEASDAVMEGALTTYILLSLQLKADILGSSLGVNGLPMVSEASITRYMAERDEGLQSENQIWSDELEILTERQPVIAALVIALFERTPENSRKHLLGGAISAYRYLRIQGEINTARATALAGSPKVGESESRIMSSIDNISGLPCLTMETYQAYQQSGKSISEITQEDADIFLRQQPELKRMICPPANDSGEVTVDEIAYMQGVFIIYKFLNIQLQANAMGTSPEADSAHGSAE